MSSYDLHSNVDDRVALIYTESPISTNTTTPGEIIDTLGFESIEFVTLSNFISGNGIFTVLLDQGDDAGLSDAAVVSDGETLGDLPQFNSADDNETRRVGSIGKKRYQRLSIVSTGISSGSGVFSSYAILSNPHTAPIQ